MSSFSQKIRSFYGKGNNNAYGTNTAYGTQGMYNQAYVAQPVIPTNGIVTEQQLAVQQQEFAQQTTTLQPIVQETIRQDRVVEVQPIIHREIDASVVNHIERHINEPAPMSRAGAIQHGAIVEERYHNRVINEIQPVIHREIAVPQVEQVQQHYVERVVATPQHTREVVYEQIPAQMGQQFIQQGYGQQTFLQPGLVNRSVLMASPAYSQGFYNTGGFGQRAIINNALPLNQVGYTGAGAGFGTGFGQQQQFIQQPGFGTGAGFGTQQQFVQQPIGTGYVQPTYLGGQQGFGMGGQPLLSNQTQYGMQQSMRGMNPTTGIQTVGTPGVATPATAPYVTSI